MVGKRKGRRGKETERVGGQEGESKEGGIDTLTRGGSGRKA